MRHFAFLLLVCISTLGFSQETEIIALPFGNQWQYNDHGAELTLQYSLPYFEETPLYNDNDWNTKQAPFGYGHQVATTLKQNTDSTDAAITTYFLAKDPKFLHFPEQINQLYLTVRYNDAFAFFFNGIEVARENLFPLSYSGTKATDDIPYTEVRLDISAYKHLLSPINYLDNFLAAELHLADQKTDSAFFDAQISYTVGARLPLPINYITAGPYLSPSTQNEAIITYYTSQPSNTVIHYGTIANNLTAEFRNDSLTTRHEARISRLTPGTTYHYEIGGIPSFMNRVDQQFVKTAPIIGKDTTTNIWVTGDFGNGLPTQHLVYADYLLKNGLNSTDLWMWLGDNAYDQGTFGEYQRNVFDIYNLTLRNHVLLPTLGNHDAKSCVTTQDIGPYFDLFTLPKNGETNTLPSGTEAYYSYNYANIHFICLESTDNNRLRGGKMMQWLEQDLKNNTAKWTIAFWHHPPYSKGSHDSDNEGQLIEMRENANPLLEKYGVDLVLNGHSHSYERTYLLDAHYGKSETFDAAIHLPQPGDGNTEPYEKTITKVGHKGTVYALVGSSGVSDFDSSLDHPAHASTSSMIGSMLLKIEANTLSAEFISPLIPSGMGDKFTIVKTNEIEPCTQLLNLNDSLITCGDKAELNVGDDFWTYQWSTGSTDSIIQVSESGYYSLEVQRFQDCFNTDSIYVQFERPEFTFSNNNPCLGDTVIITATNTNNITWNNSNTAPTYTMYQEDSVAYTATVNGCTTSDTIFLSYSKIDFIDIEVKNENGQLQDPFTFIINNRMVYDSVVWFFGDGITDTISVGEHTYTYPGNYRVVLTAFKNGCSTQEFFKVNRVINSIEQESARRTNVHFSNQKLEVENSDATNFTVINSIGKIVANGMLTSNTIELKNISKGNYWIRLSGNNKAETKSFVVD
tara:strand:+ start:78039 stop:80774 length:2736 start_codon:yes stop_codon:yes gene_type:complete